MTLAILKVRIPNVCSDQDWVCQCAISINICRQRVTPSFPFLGQGDVVYTSSAFSSDEYAGVIPDNLIGANSLKLLERSQDLTAIEPMWSMPTSK